jgi:hypothetical protein
MDMQPSPMRDTSSPPIEIYFMVTLLLEVARCFR